MREDVHLDATQVASILQSQFCELTPATVVLLGEGCDSYAFDVNGQWVFRFPKRADVEQQLAIETSVLPILAEHSPLSLPVFLFHGKASDAFPYRFAGYRKLPGIPAIQLDERAMPLARWAPALGRFLSWLHEFPVRDAEGLRVPRQDVAALIEEVRADALDDFDLLHDVMEAAPLQEWRAFLATACRNSPATSAPVLVHRDLASEHVLYDPAAQHVTGIIDWSDLAISDRSVDLAGFFHWGGQACIDAVLSTYDHSIDKDALTRARFLAACRGVADVAFGLDTGRREYIQAGTRALAMCLHSKSSSPFSS